MIVDGLKNHSWAEEKTPRGRVWHSHPATVAAFKEAGRLDGWAILLDISSLQSSSDVMQDSTQWTPWSRSAAGRQRLVIQRRIRGGTTLCDWPSTVKLASSRYFSGAQKGSSTASHWWLRWLSGLNGEKSTQLTHRIAVLAEVRLSCVNTFLGIRVATRKVLLPARTTNTAEPQLPGFSTLRTFI